jgi:hypothetical protein
MHNVGGQGVRKQESSGGWSRLLVGMQGMASTIFMLAVLQPADAAVFDIPSGDVLALIMAIHTANGNDEDDTITLEAGTYTLTEVDNEPADPFGGANGLPVIASGMTINGADAANTIIARDASAPPFRIFQIAATGVLTLDGVTVTGGKAQDSDGGGIRNDGTLALINSIVSNNESSMTTGGILNSFGTVVLINSTVSDNRAESNAGGIANEGGTMLLINSTVSGNTAGE